jgi:hypothetical protein
METLRPEPVTIEEVQAAIEGVNEQILLLEIQRERYEKMGHHIIEVMMGIE